MRRRAAGKRRDPIEYIGTVVKNTGTSINDFDSSGEAADVLSIASPGDLVVVNFGVNTALGGGWAWAGMPFTTLIDEIGSALQTPYRTVGYRFVEGSDSNPYITGATAFSGSNPKAIFSVFRNVRNFIDDAHSTGGFVSGEPNPPNLIADGQLWLAIANTAGGTTPTPPSDYTLAATETYTGIAYRFTDAASQDPGVFSLSTSQRWKASTLAFGGRLT